MLEMISDDRNNTITEKCFTESSLFPQVLTIFLMPIQNTTLSPNLFLSILLHFCRISHVVFIENIQASISSRILYDRTTTRSCVPMYFELSRLYTKLYMKAILKTLRGIERKHFCLTAVREWDLLERFCQKIK